MLNEFATIMMKLRTENHESSTVMSQKLGIDRKDLSSMEVGMVSVPEGLPEKIAEVYGLDNETLEKLKAASSFKADGRIDLDNPCTGFGFGKKDQITQSESNDL